MLGTLTQYNNATQLYIRYTQYSSWYICILLDCSGMDVTIKILFKKSVVIYCWVLDHEEVKVGVWRDGHTIYLKSPARIPHKNFVHIFFVFLYVTCPAPHNFDCINESSVSISLWVVQQPSSSTYILYKPVSFNVHPSFYMTFFITCSYLDLSFSLGHYSFSFVFKPLLGFCLGLLFSTFISKIFIFKNILFISCSLV